jgi:diguanylate cyclase (GGDEF)-like protein
MNMLPTRRARRRDEPLRVSLHSTVVPRRAILVSALALAVPIAAAFLRIAAPDYEVLLWLLSLVPAFLLAYYRGWRGAATALALGMAALSVTQAVVLALGIRVENWPFLLAVTVLFIALALGVGILAEMLHNIREQAERLAFTDDLTGLANRRYAQRLLEAEVAAAVRGRSLVVVLFDIDDFKLYNDQLGHTAGDEALRAVARVLERNTRRMNLSARWGGEEFLSILAGTELPGALIFVERVRRGLASQPPASGPITLSAGVAACSPGIESPEALVLLADQALFRAKRGGKNRVDVSDPSRPGAVLTDAAHG